MKQSVLQSNMTLSVRRDKGITPLHLRRLIACTDVKTAVKILLEVKYGEGLSKEAAADFNALIDREQNALIKDFEEIYPDENITNCFLSEYLYHNAKVFYKLRLLDPPVLNPKSLYNYKTEIKEGILEKNYQGLPLTLKTALNKLDQKDIPTALEIDVELDKAYYTEIAQRLQKSSNKPIKKYFSARVDLINICTLYRAYLLKLPLETVSDMLLPAFLPREYKEIYNQPISQWADSFKDTDYYDIVVLLIGNQKQAGDFTAFERARDNYLTEIFKKNTDNYFKSDGVIYYYLSKLNEIKTVRMIMIYIANGMNKEALGGLINGNNR